MSVIQNKEKRFTILQEYENSVEKEQIEIKKKA